GSPRAGTRPGNRAGGSRHRPPIRDVLTGAAFPSAPEVDEAPALAPEFGGREAVGAMTRVKAVDPAEHVLEIVTPRTNTARLSSAEHLFGTLSDRGQPGSREGRT